MTVIADLHREHLALNTLAAVLEPQESMSVQATERIRSSLNTFAARLAEHMAHEDPILAELCAAPSGSAMRLVGEIRRREALALVESCNACISHWTRPGVLERDPRGFSSIWTILRAALSRLIAREEDEIYPLTAAEWMPRPVSAPALTGIAELDEDHAEVFALIGGLRAALGGGLRIIDGASVAALAAYAERHFARITA
jgi:iron-sulfur cluster repair protein YtfE (RIC family)